MFFNSWIDVIRILIIAPMTYIALIAILRISGKRTLSKMNMFDFVITVALGSTFATSVLSKDVALAEGMTALGLLIFLQYSVAWLSVRSKAFRQIVKGEPSLLFYRGHYLRESMQAERIALEEIRAAARAHGISDMNELAAVVLETDGTFSVVPEVTSGENSALLDVDVSKRQSDTSQRSAEVKE